MLLPIIVIINSLKMTLSVYLNSRCAVFNRFLLIALAIILTSFRSLDCRDGDKISTVSRFNFFDTDLLHYSAETGIGNIIVSPASVKSILSMLLEGARGVTETEIRQALRLSQDKEECRRQLSLYLQALQMNTTGAFVQNANAIFVSNKLKPKKDFVGMLKQVYNSEMQMLDFRNTDNVSDTINKWVNSRTRGLIPFIVEPTHIDPATQILVTNALYFKGAWKYGFDPKLTRPGCFHVKGMCRTVVMMEMQAELNYAYVDNLRAHALELPYEGGRYSMILLVPHEHDGAISLIRDLPYMSLPEISKLMEPSDVFLSLPKFSIDYGEDLAGPLQSMHINSLFSSSSNLSGIFEGDSPHITNIYHRVHMTVDEVGTVAAAVSIAMIVPLIENGVQLRVDRPFVFFIKDNSLGLVLFEGKIEEPTEFVERTVPNYIGQPQIMIEPKRQATKTSNKLSRRTLG